MARIVKSSLDLSGKIVSWTDKELAKLVKEKTKKFEKEIIKEEPIKETVEEVKEEPIEEPIEEPVKEEEEGKLFKSNKKSDRRRK